MKKTIIIAIVALIVGLGGGFYGGMTYQKNKTSSGSFARTGTAATRAGRTGSFAGTTGGGAAAFVATGGGASLTTGQVVAKNDQNITVSLASGGSKIVFFTSSTPITAMVQKTPNDIAVGSSVSLSGSANSDGSMTATMIQLRPASGTPSSTGR